jgi:predicted Rossmann-fold nucleotide-binding protein
MSNNMIKRVCVNCGSSPGSDPAFISAARDFGDCLAGRDITVVYGGADVGLMGAVANAALGAARGAIDAQAQADDV